MPDFRKLSPFAVTTVRLQAGNSGARATMRSSKEMRYDGVAGGVGLERILPVRGQAKKQRKQNTQSRASSAHKSPQDAVVRKVPLNPRSIFPLENSSAFQSAKRSDKKSIPCLRFTESLAVSAQDSGPSGSLVLSGKNFA